MEQFGDGHRVVKIKEIVQVVNIVAVVEELEDGDEPIERELIVSSNRRPIPVPYTEEP